MKKYTKKRRGGGRRGGSSREARDSLSLFAASLWAYRSPLSCGFTFGSGGLHGLPPQGGSRRSSSPGRACCRRPPVGPMRSPGPRARWNRPRGTEGGGSTVGLIELCSRAAAAGGRPVRVRERPVGPCPCAPPPLATAVPGPRGLRRACRTAPALLRRLQERRLWDGWTAGTAHATARRRRRAQDAVLPVPPSGTWLRPNPHPCRIGARHGSAFTNCLGTATRGCRKCRRSSRCQSRSPRTRP